MDNVVLVNNISLSNFKAIQNLSLKLLMLPARGYRKIKICFLRLRVMDSAIRSHFRYQMTRPMDKLASS